MKEDVKILDDFTLKGPLVAELICDLSLTVLGPRVSEVVFEADPPGETLIKQQTDRGLSPGVKGRRPKHGGLKVDLHSHGRNVVFRILLPEIRLEIEGQRLEARESRLTCLP